MTLCNYDPQIVGGNNSITPPPLTNPKTLVNRTTVLFQYPFDTPSLTLELRNPELNDQRTIDLSRIQRYSIGRELILYRSNNWPKFLSLSYSFRGLKLQQSDNIKTFIKTTLGKEIKFTDYQSQEYKVIITNPREFISEEFANCGFTWAVNLQGVLV